MSGQPTTHHAAICAIGPFRDFVTGLVLNSQVSAGMAGLGPTDVYTLNLLGTAGPLTAGQLAERTALTTGAVTRLIDRLERAGHVRRVPDPVDRRRVHVEIEPNRDAVFNTLLESAQRRIGEILDSLAEEERHVLFEFFARAAPALCEEAENTRAGNRPPAPAASPLTPATLASPSTPPSPVAPVTPSAAAPTPADLISPFGISAPLGPVAPQPTSDQP